ncbi:MAG: hypothetical protein Q9218_002122 [Villophora microphyllina]
MVMTSSFYPSSLLLRVRKTLGFTSLSGLLTFLTLTLTFLTFIISQSSHLDVANGLCGPHRSTLRAGQCYYYTHPTLTRYGTALSIHLACIFPAGLLAVTQFIPRLRQRYPVVHRWAGRTSLALCFPGVLSVPFLLDRAFGGGLDTRSSSTLLCGLTLWAVTQAWLTARRRDFKEHRKWATRAWTWLGCIVTHRAIIAGFAVYASLAGPRLAASIPCPQIWNMVENAYRGGGGTAEAQRVWGDKYAGMCSPKIVGMVQGLGFSLIGNETTSAVVESERYGLVTTDFLNGMPEEKAAALYLAFGPAFWKDGGKKGVAGRGSLSNGKDGPLTTVGEKSVKAL